MKDLKRLPIYYQNAEVTDINDKEKELPVAEKNYINISFYQTKLHHPKIFYKPVSKIWILNEE